MINLVKENFECRSILKTISKKGHDQKDLPHLPHPGATCRNLPRLGAAPAAPAALRRLRRLKTRRILPHSGA